MSKKVTKIAKNTFPSRKDYVESALVLASDMPWELINLEDIALQAKGSLSHMREYFDEKSDILGAYGAIIDQEMLKEADRLDSNLSVKDKLFELIMARFDVVEDNRAGVLSILNSIKLDPKTILYSLPHLCRSMTWVLEATGQNTSGVKGTAKIIGLTGVYLKTLRSWMSEESTDLSQTMASLDKGLAQAESWGERLGF